MEPGKADSHRVYANKDIGQVPVQGREVLEGWKLPDKISQVIGEHISGGSNHRLFVTWYHSGL